MVRLRLGGGDGGSYGPEFGPVEGFTDGEVRQGSQRYTLILLADPATVDGEAVEAVVVVPRYVGVPMEDVLNQPTTVGIARVKPGRLDAVRAGEVTENTVYFAVGATAPAEGPWPPRFRAGKM